MMIYFKQTPPVIVQSSTIPTTLKTHEIGPMEKVHQKTTSSTRKRKRGERVFQFDNFCEPGQPISFTGSFQVNVKALLAFGHAEPDVHEGTRFWSFQLELHLYPPACVRLFVAEEAVELSQHRQCYYCRSVGNKIRKI